MLEYDITEALTLHVEGRYTDEKQFIAGPSGPRIVDALGINPPFIPVLVPASSPSIPANASDSFFTPRFSIEYAANEDMLFYGSVAKGAKPGGISTVGAGASGFDPQGFAFDRESMWVYELGTKTSWDEGKVVLNAAVYYEDFSGKQTSSQVQLSNGLVGTRTVNASSAEVKGLEIDAAWAPVEGMNLSAGYSYIDATYGDFKTNSSGVAAIAAVGNCTVVTVGTSLSCELDRTGNRLEGVAKHSLVLGASYERPLVDDINWLIETDVQYQTNRFDTADNILQLQGYWMVDLRAGLTSDNWSVVAFANNLFNDDTVKQAFNTTDFNTIGFGFFPPPFTFVLENALQAQLPDKRQIGIRTTFNF